MFDVKKTTSTRVCYMYFKVKVFKTLDNLVSKWFCGSIRRSNNVLSHRRHEFKILVFVHTKWSTAE